MNKKTCVVLLLLLIYLLFANNIIAFFANGDHQLKNVNLKKAAGYAAVYYGLDDINIQNDFLEKIYISGWAFCEAETKENSTIEIVLESTNKAYKVNSTLHTRGDIYEIFANKNMSLVNSEVGFTLTFSTVALRDGDYKVSILCSENPNVVGLGETGIILRKNGNQMTRVYASGDEIINGTENPNIRFEIDSIAVSNNILKMSGWGILQGKSSNELNYYLKISSPEGTQKIYPLVQGPRKDIAAAFASDEYLKTGFSLEINYDENIFKEGTQLEFLASSVQGETYCSAYQKEVYINESGGFSAKNK